MRSSDGRSRGLLASCGLAGALGHPRPEDLLADVLDLDRAGLVGQVRERRLHRDEPVHQVRLVVLEAQVEDVRLAAGGDVAGHLEGHRGLAGALRPADEQQLAGAQAGADGLVERGEPERDGLVLARWPVVTLSLRSTRTSSARARRHAPVIGIEAPAPCVGGRAASASAVGAHAVGSSPEAVRSARRACGGRSVAPASGPVSPIRYWPALHLHAAAWRSRRTSRRWPGWRSRSSSRSIHSFGAWACSCGWVKPEQHDRQPEDRVEARPRPGSSHPPA